VIQAQGWHLGDAEQLGGEQPAMAGDDVAVAVGQDRDNEAEKLDAIGNLPNLLLLWRLGLAGSSLSWSTGR
jgi:hypothetical protein